MITKAREKDENEVKRNDNEVKFGDNVKGKEGSSDRYAQSQAFT